MDAERIRFVREQYGMSVMEAKRAVSVADERFDGDLKLGALWVYASGLAINVRGGPEARAEWNDRYARNRANDERFGSSI